MTTSATFEATHQAPGHLRNTAGFTLYELLVVLGILSLVMGVSVGVVQRSVPRRELARNQIIDRIQRARSFAQRESAPAWMVITPGTEERWPVASALGLKVVGQWHLEDDSAVGFPEDGKVTGWEETQPGVIGQALLLSDQEPSWIRFGRHSSFESEEGLGFEIWVKPRGQWPRQLASKGEVFQVACDAEGRLSARVRLQSKAGGRPVIESLETEEAVLVAGEWTKVVFTFDGFVLRLEANDFPVATKSLQEPGRLLPDSQAPLMVGRESQPFSAVVDEVRFGSFVRDSSEPLIDMVLLSEARRVRFAPGGELDPQEHSAPVELGMADVAGAEMWIRVGLLGDVN